MPILADAHPSSPARPDRITRHPNWCQSDLCTGELADGGAWLVTHRLDVTFRRVAELTGHTEAIHIVRTDRVASSGAAIDAGTPRIDVAGVPEAELEPLEYVYRMLAVIDAEAIVRAVLGVELSPHHATAVQAVARSRRTARRCLVSAGGQLEAATSPAGAAGDPQARGRSIVVALAAVTTGGDQ